MTSEWKSATFGEACLKITDGAHNSPASVLHGKPMASVKDLTRFGVDLKSARLISQEDFDLLVKQGCKPSVGDVLIAKDGNSALDTVCSVDSELDAVLLSSVAILRPNPELLDSHFLKFYLSSPDVIGYLKNNFISGAAIPRVVLRDFKKAKISLPPLEEQKKIAAIFQALDDRIALLRETNISFEAIAQALFKSWFVDFDPVHANAGNQEHTLPPEVQALFPSRFVESSQGLIPKGWKIAELGDFLGVLATGRRPKGGVASFSEGIPSIGAESINGIGNFNFSKTKYVPIEFFEKMKSGLIEDYDVLLYKDGGKPGEFKPRVSMFGNSFPFETFAINEHVFRMRSDYLGQAFLYFFVSHERTLSELSNRGGKAAIPGINQTDVKTLKIIAPPKCVLDAFQNSVEPFLCKILANASQSHNLANLRDTLLPRLISGQLRLPEAEATLAEVG
ncbi:MAG: restriction endonuclease subunit S [Alishewanella aestuarii]